MKSWFAVVLLAFASLPECLAGTVSTDPMAENMLRMQTASGGWSKHFKGKAVDYTHPLGVEDIAALQAPGRADDATIDNRATTREIRHLADAYRGTDNAAYLAAAERGVAYLLAAQYENGGWPQYYPDRSLYRHQITYNDDAMVRVLDLLQDVAEGRGSLAALTAGFGERARSAVARGIDCILATQVRIDGQPTVWAAQYDETTLQPAKARSYELPALAVSESVGVVRFLMRQRPARSDIVAAVEAAARWLERHRLPDLALQRIEAPQEETGRDVVVVAQPGASLWARFYDPQAQRPLFVDRDGGVLAAFTDMPNERRVGYAWYGTWPQKLLDQDLPRWRREITAQRKPQR